MFAYLYCKQTENLPSTQHRDSSLMLICVGKFVDWISCTQTQNNVIKQGSTSICMFAYHGERI